VNWGDNLNSSLHLGKKPYRQVKLKERSKWGSMMAEAPRQFETEEVKVIRGFEAKKISEYENDGWELVSQAEGKLRTTITFRRPKKPIPLKLVVSGVAGVLVLATIITVGALTEDKTARPNTTVTTSTPETSEPEQVEPEPEESTEVVLTAETNSDVARLLKPKSEEYAFWQVFYDKYKGRSIELDANVADMLLLGDSQYTYSVLFYPGDYSDDTAYGPPMRDPRVVIPYDWHKTNPDDIVVRRSNIRLVARIVDFNSDTNVFDIQIEATTERK